MREVFDLGDGGVVARGELFVDTSAWYPLVVRNHPAHRAVSAVLRAQVRRGTRVVITNLILAETHALLLHRADRDAALAFAVAVREAPNALVTSTPDLEAKAITDWIVPFGDQAFSFTDAVSFAVMTERGIGEALTLDQHFATAGFRMLPEGRVAP